MPKRTAESPAARFLRKRIGSIPRLAIVLGSGFGGVANHLTSAIEIPYSEIPGWPVGKVVGHASKVISGRLNGVSVLALAGRAHFYEGFSMEEVAFGIHVLADLGVEAVLLTNAAGGIKAGMRPGDFMIIEDHINFMGVNPLRGPVAPGRERFIDMTQAYYPALLGCLARSARFARARVHRGVYLAVSGPSFETPAEIRAFRSLGASAVGMSTVPEAVAARQRGLRIAGLSCITNVAAGLGGRGQTVNHAEVLETASRAEGVATKLIGRFVQLWDAGRNEV